MFVTSKLRLETNPNLIIDDGSDVVATMIKQKPELIDNLIGTTEETTTRNCPSQGDDDRGRPQLPFYSRQRRTDKALLRQPLWNGTINA
jgi:hypothetical protein